MKKELNIIGLDCGHCALTLEKYLEKINGVNECIVNFSTSKIFLDIDDEKYKSIMREIYKTTKQVNPSVTLSESVNNDNGTRVYDIILYIIGVILGIVTLFLKTKLVLFYVLLIISSLLLGYKTYYKAIVQLKGFKVNENTLITISVYGAILLGESMEGIMVIALYTMGKFLESKAVNYSRKSISNLITSQPEFAVILSDGVEKKVKPEVVQIDDIIIVKPGEKVPLDGIVIEGNATADKRHLTGESLPISIKAGDTIESGSIILDSAVTIKVTSLYKDSTVSKILNLVSNATNKKSKTETFISKFSSYYTLGVIISAIIVWGITWLILGDISTAIYRGLIFLVVSCPCAFAISVPLTYFSGIGRCSKNGILIKGSNYLDYCSKLDTIVFDKTGTLTTGNFKVVKVECEDEKKFFEIVVAGEQNSIHPIAKAICEYAGKQKKIKIKNYHETSGSGIEFEFEDDKYFIGRGSSKESSTVVTVLKNGKHLGTIYLRDEIKENTVQVIKDIKDLKIKTIMLTGDNNYVAKCVANEIGIDEYNSKLLPQDKFKILDNLKKDGKRISFVGDGINDAPALTMSDVGISMGIMGSPATIECSDVVIADDNLSKIPSLIKISKRTKRIVFQNIIFAGVTKLTFLVLGALGITGMLLAVFADVGVTLLAILNSLRVLLYKDKK
ncbi:MAG: cadmium-translocating P-type ATPase [Clostridiales bacterium]|nr:cadmium-translocating P-type ATPase [Clostridiales bacterium]